MEGLFRDFGNFGNIFNVMIMRMIPALLCITIHELAHGYVAYKLGDNTAKNLGRLTLNPIKHIDPVGLLMMLVIGFGWAKPVPVNMHNFKHPKWGMALTALAGPVSNILLAVVVWFILGLVASPLGVSYDVTTGMALVASSTGFTIFSVIRTMIILSIALAVFNMLPIPPLDGSKVLFSLLPEGAYYKLMRYERFGMIFLLVIMGTRFLLNIDILGVTIWPLASAIDNSLNFLYTFAYTLVN
ncbi:MAG: site-2 protease family protein [Oscillospiraceae bacterium]|nr:site-2 protease family protein [Oscillospiraceae bacterium]